MLSAALVAALVMIVLALPGLDAAPESTEVSLDFATFVPGVEQVSRPPSSTCPCRRRVREAGRVLPGFARDIDFTFELCEGAEVSAARRRRHRHARRVPHAGHGAARTAIATPGAEGQVAGRILLAESSSTPTFDRSQLVWLATIGLIAVIAIGVVVHRVRALRMVTS